MDQGWIKLHRKLLDNPIASNGQLLGFFCYLLLRTNHKKHSFYLGYEKIHQNPGECIVSQKKLASNFKVSIGTINNRLKILRSESIIETKTTNKYTIVIVLKREDYQGNGKQTENKLKTNGKQTETIKNDKNEKNDKNRKKYIKKEKYISSKNSNSSKQESVNQKEKKVAGKKRKRFIAPTIDEIKKYIQEKKLQSVDAEEFFYFYDSKDRYVGKVKMKNWRSAVSGWNTRNRKQQAPPSSIKGKKASEL